MPAEKPTSFPSRLRVVQIVSAISEEASGPTYVVTRLCDSLIERGHDVTLATLDWAPMQRFPSYHRTFPLGIGPRKIGSSPAMRRWLVEKASVRKLDVIHSHGLWMMPNVYPGKIANTYNIPLIVAPHDTLSKWSMQFGSRLKEIFWPAVQRPALVLATCFHATAESEYIDIRRLGFKQPVAIIPNAIDILPLHPRKSRQGRTLLFLSRIHPQKGLDILLKAWQAVEDRYPDWSLRIVGSDQGFYEPSSHLRYIQDLASGLGLKRIEFSGALYGDAKLQAYSDADLFVLSSYSENFAVVVAEALAAGIPAIVSKGAPWSGLNAHGAGWWIDIGVDPLIGCLEHALERPACDLQTMGQQGRAWMERDFSWQRIGEQMAETYHWLCDRSIPKPSWVRVD